MFADPEPPQDCIDLAKKWHPFPLGYGIMRAIIAEDFKFVLATGFSTKHGVLYVNGLIYRAETNSGEFLWAKATQDGPREIPMNELSHHNSFLFWHNGESWINYIIKK